MSHWRQAWLVATWEFGRYFKWRDQFLGLAIFLVFGALSWGVGRFASAAGRSVTVAVSGIELAPPAGSRLRLVEASADSTEHAALLADGKVGGVLRRRADGSFELLVEKDPRYLTELRGALAEVTRRERLAESGLPETQLIGILAPPELTVRFADPERQRVGRSERIVAGIALGLIMLAVFTSMAYLLTGITGEKQLRVTESITAIIPPQAWIDGKILGIGAYALANTASMVVGGLLLAMVAKLTWGFSIPSVVVRPGVIVVLVVFAALALAMWNAAFAAFASTIDDPNTSARTSVMFLPMIPVAMSVSVFRDPDHIGSRMLALFPLTSPSAMPIRVMLSNPGILEIIGAVIVLLATIWLFRRLAGRIFEIGMLMYGKEPSLREMWRWATSRAS